MCNYHHYAGGVNSQALRETTSKRPIKEKLHCWLKDLQIKTAKLKPSGNQLEYNKEYKVDSKLK